MVRTSRELAIIRSGCCGLLVVAGCGGATGTESIDEAQAALLVHCPAGEAPSCTVIRGKNVCVCEPIDLPPPPSFVGVASGPSRHFSWRTNGYAVAWGSNNTGSSSSPSYFGDDDGTGSHSPRFIPALSDVAEIDTDYNFACARSNAGTVSCWGDLGIPSPGAPMFHSNLPLAISGLSSIKQIAVGFDHACAVRSDGTVWCWGLDGVGQLGDGASGSPYITLTAHAVVGLADATQIAAGLQSTCALRAAGNVACWGSNSYGVLGNGSPGMPFATTPITTLLPVPAVSLSHRDGSVLVTTADGSVYGWGVNETGEFGDGIGPIRWVPTLAPALHGAHGFQISAGTGGLGSHCAIFSDGQTRCWGYNSLGQLADGTTVDHFFPAPVIGGLSLSVLSGNGQSRCGISTAGGLYCWGSNYAGELGTGGVVPGGGTSPPNPVPALVSF